MAITPLLNTASPSYQSPSVSGSNPSTTRVNSQRVDSYQNSANSQAVWSPYQAEQLDDEIVQVDTTEFSIRKPSSNSPYEIREQVMRKLGMTPADIAAYLAAYPDDPETGRPKNNGFYIQDSNHPQRWATSDEVSKWETDSQGNTPIGVPSSSVEHLKAFRNARMAGNLFRSLGGVSDAQLRARLGEDLKALITTRGEEQMQAFDRLQQLASEADPQRRDQIESALQKLAEQGGYGDNARLRLVQARFASLRNQNRMGPVVESEARQDASRYLNQAQSLLEQDYQSGRLSRQDMAGLQWRAANEYQRNGDEGGRAYAERLARFASLSDEERQQAANRVGDDFFYRGTIPRVTPSKEGETSMSSVSDQQQALDRFNQANQPQYEKRDLAEDPWKKTYPGQPRLDNRHLRISGGVGALEEINKWVSLYGKMQKATQTIQKRDQLQREARLADNYPIPPKPEELPVLKARLLQLGMPANEVDSFMAEVTRQSNLFWR